MYTAAQFAAAIDTIKDALAGIIETAAPDAKVIKRFVYDPNDEYWVGLLRNDDDLDTNNAPRVHTICVYYAGLDQSEGDEPIRSVNPLLPFGIIFYQAYELGTDTDNSEARLMDEIANVMWAIEASTDLGMNEVDESNAGKGWVMGHHGLRVPRMAMSKVGAYPIWIARGELMVRMQSRRVR